MSWTETIKRFESLKAEEQKLSAKLERAKGSLSAHKKTLKDRFKCGSVEEAKEILRQLGEQNSERADQLEKLLQEIEEGVSGYNED